MLDVVVAAVRLGPARDQVLSHTNAGCCAAGQRHPAVAQRLHHDYTLLTRPSLARILGHQEVRGRPHLPLQRLRCLNSP